MQLYNYLSRKVEEFKPILDKSVGMYTCGPTVYDYVHIGNWRTFIFEDVLKRVLTFDGLEVKHVMNITDIDDKIIKKSKEEGIELGELTGKYEAAFKKDLTSLNIIPADFYPRATEHIEHMVLLIQKLLEKGAAYKAEDGVYFSVDKFKGYGRLSGLLGANLKKGARVNEDLYDKESWSDFALWKFEKPGEPSWEASFGKGRPGWHIECSEMSTDILGNHFDIHCGGVDLLFPHHENEIAQSEAANGEKFANFWLEGEHLLVDGQKMSKSLGNIFAIEDVIKQDFDPLALRYLFLTAHYRSKLNFSWESLKAAQNALGNLKQIVASWDSIKASSGGLEEYEKDFRNAVNNDLDMPRAIAVVWEMAKSDKPTNLKHQSLLVMDKVLGLGLADIKKSVLSKEAKELIKKRDKFRNEGKFTESDRIRQELLALGVEIEDTPQGSTWKKVKN